MGARWDRAAGLAFATLGAGLAVAGWRLPEGLSGVPGPGVFPLLIGAGLAACGAGLAASARPPADAYWPHGWRGHPLRQVAAILALLAAYVALWDAVPFLWRTPVLLVAIYRVAGEPWVPSALAATGTTALLFLVFDLLLRVRL